MSYDIPPPVPRQRRGCMSCFGMVVALCLAATAGGVLTVAVVFGWISLTDLEDLSFEPGVAVLDVCGDIENEQPVLDDLDLLLNNSATKALVVRVDSPGGAIAVVEEIYEAILRAQAKGMPVVASMGSTAASGGYLVCLPAERIFANQGSLTGSIGVLLEYSSAKDLFDKVGIKFDTIVSGEFKGEGGLASPLTERQRAQLQEVVLDYHEQFVELLIKHRKIPPQQIRELADGRVFTGRQALALGLVDEIGTLDDAVNYAAKLANLGETPRVIRVKPEGFSWLSEVGKLGGEASSRLSRCGMVPKYLMR